MQNKDLTHLTLYIILLRIILRDFVKLELPRKIKDLQYYVRNMPV